MQKFKTGDRVKHERYGFGTVVDADAAEILPVLVKFDTPNSRLHRGNDEFDMANLQHWFFAEDGSYAGEGITLVEE